MTIPSPIAHGINAAFRFSAIAICLASIDFSAIPEPYKALSLIGVLTFAAVYLVMTTALALRKRQDNGTAEPDEIESKLGYLDCFLLGAIALLLPADSTVLLALVALTAVRAAAVGGAADLSGQLCILLAGALLAMGLFSPDINWAAFESANATALVIAFSFMVFVVWRMQLHQHRLTFTARQLNANNIRLKLNNYKLAKYLSPSLRKAIISGKRVALETQRKRVTVFFSDIRGFSELSEELEADTLTSMLNLYLTEMSDIALKFGGTVDKFIGDAIMVFFGDPITRGAKEDCIACVSMAITMQKRMNDLNKRWACQGIRTPLSIRMGINTGFCTVGNFGTENRMDYTLLGTEVNKASRLESAADAGEILISRQTYELIKDTIFCEKRGSVRLKGFKAPVEIFAVVDLRANLGRDGTTCLEHSTDGFTMFMDVDNIPHLQKHRILASLEEAYEQLREDIEFNTKDDVKIFK